MKTRKLIALLAAGVAALALSAMPAGAEDTTVDFTIAAAGNGLQLAQSGNTSTLSDGAGGELGFEGGTTMAGALPQTTVTDERGDLLATWTVTVSASTPFTNSDGDTVALNNAHVYMDAADAASLETALGGALSGMSITGGEFTGGTNDLSSAYALLSGTTTDLGLGSAPSVTYTPSIDVAVPQGTPVGTYSATVTQTAS